MNEKLEKLTIPEEDLKGLRVGETRDFDFDDGSETPRIAFLQTPDLTVRGIGERQKSDYAGGRIIATYKITSLYKS